MLIQDTDLFQWTYFIYEAKFLLQNEASRCNMFVLSGTVLELELTAKINDMGIFYSNMKRTVLKVQSIVRHAN